ncbi:MAG: CBS domain-containing protein, partial [Ottowia sp.]|nr:CBS domain-containing protein [Ottowia sp.]
MPHPAPDGARPGQRRLLKKLADFLHPGPDSTDELLGAFATAEQRHIIDAESRAMLEGALRLAEMCAGDVMLAAPRMVLLDIDAPYEELLDRVIDSGHSRFPVFQENHENIIGILMAKDLLKVQRAPDLNVRALLRPA